MPYLKIGKFEIAVWVRLGGTLIWFGYADNGWIYEDGDRRRTSMVDENSTVYEFRQFDLQRFRPDAKPRDWKTERFFKFHTNLFSNIRYRFGRLLKAVQNP